MTFHKKYIGLILLPSLLLLFFFYLLYHVDNKYQTPPPYGKDGVLILTEKNIRENGQIFLIDGWLFSSGSIKDRPTYIGEYSNLSRGNGKTNPHGTAAYQLTLDYSGTPIEAALNFPWIFHQYTLSLDGKTLSKGTGGLKTSFLLTPGKHKLQILTTSSTGYYSGIYHPPVLFATENQFKPLFTTCVAYGFAFFVPLSLALYSLGLWRSSGDRPAFWFGLLCCFFSLYVSYYFVRLFGMPFSAYWYLVQSGAFYGLCFCVIRLTILSCGISQEKISHLVQKIIGGFSLLLLFLSVSIPIIPKVILLHGKLTDFYYILTFCSVLFLLFCSTPTKTWEHAFTLISCTMFGTGLLCNLFWSNQFEPILFFWQFEWCGLFMVILFGGMMAARNKRILIENETFQCHLEELVEKRTEELTLLLQERKAFFADMAHDLKAPIYATKSFIEAIRANGTGIDGDLLRYIDEVERRQQEMAHRVQGLTLLNQIDDVPEKAELLSIQALLNEIYHTHCMAAEVQSVHLTVHFTGEDGYLLAQPKKISILFENLIFNALRATSAGGSITILAETDEDGCHFSISDTGSGIPEDELPHIFDRFYVGKKHKGTGSGLGLYIVHTIVEELLGEITVSTKPDKGTIFYIDLPLTKI